MLQGSPQTCRLLVPSETEALRRLLERDSASNLHLLSMLEVPGLVALPGRCYGAFRAGALEAVAYLSEGGLVVPCGEVPAALDFLGQRLRRDLERVRVLVGPRAACDRIWGQLCAAGDCPEPRLLRDHALLRLDAASLTEGPHEAIERARSTDLDELVQLSAAMRLEELGDDILAANPDGFRRWVRARLIAGRSWVVRDAQGIAFKVELGPSSLKGIQLEGVYTRPDRRGERLCSRSMRGLALRLLQGYPALTLHVWEQNLPAVASYTRVGWLPHSDYRVILR